MVQVPPCIYAMSLYIKKKKKTLMSNILKVSVAVKDNNL